MYSRTFLNASGLGSIRLRSLAAWICFGDGSNLDLLAATPWILRGNHLPSLDNQLLLQTSLHQLSDSWNRDLCYGWNEPSTWSSAHHWAFHWSTLFGIFCCIWLVIVQLQHHGASLWSRDFWTSISSALCKWSHRFSETSLKYLQRCEKAMCWYTAQCNCCCFTQKPL